MTGDVLPDDANVVRYVRPGQIDGDTVDGSAFRLRANESGLSVHWLEIFEDLAKTEQLDEVRRLSRLSMSRNGRLAELNVAEAIQHISDMLDSPRIVHSPLDAADLYEADPSHSEFLGLPDSESPEAALIGDMIAELVLAVHPTRPESG